MARMKTYGGKSIESSYFKWLCDIVSPVWTGEDYYLMLKQLFDKEFIWFIHSDENRYFDALQLRRESFYSRYGSKVNCLEVLVTLAMHMDDILYDEDRGEVVERWFWELMENIELTKYPDDEYNPAEIEDILEKWLNRDHQKPQQKTVFPLSKSGGRDVSSELWYEMAQYIERFHRFL